MIMKYEVLNELSVEDKLYALILLYRDWSASTKYARYVYDILPSVI